MCMCKCVPREDFSFLLSISLFFIYLIHKSGLRATRTNWIVDFNQKYIKLRSQIGQSLQVRLK